MTFYEVLSEYYDYIFPVGADQINFIKNIAGDPPKTILDIACGTGGYSLELASQGYQVVAIDLDAGMIEMLREKSQDGNIDIMAIQGNMLELDQTLKGKYDMAFCIGNSLVHLEGEKEIGKFFSQVKKLLADGGTLVIQIINYDRVLAKEITSLPTIENKEAGLVFKRYYRYAPLPNKIFFRTALEVEGKKIENEIPLYPILSDNLCQLLKNAGFQNIRLFGDFKGNDYDRNESYALVVSAS